MNWAVKTFENSSALDSLNKLLEERDEVIKSLKGYKQFDLKAEEYVDCIMCLLHSAKKSGINFDEIDKSFRKKFYINRMRTWKQNPDGTYSHIEKLT